LINPICRTRVGDALGRPGMPDAISDADPLRFDATASGSIDIVAE
jgi:hypothetical protein